MTNERVIDCLKLILSFQSKIEFCVVCNLPWLCLSYFQICSYTFHHSPHTMAIPGGLDNLVSCKYNKKWKRLKLCLAFVLHDLFTIRIALMRVMKCSQMLIFFKNYKIGCYIPGHATKRHRFEVANRIANKIPGMKVS